MFEPTAFPVCSASLTICGSRVQRRFRLPSRQPHVILVIGVNYILTRRLPHVSRILLVESGSRSIMEGIILGLRQTYGPDMFIDLVTCYQGLPEGLRPETTNVFRVTDYRGKAGRARLYAELRRNRYSILGIICSAESIMTKWKWSLAARLP